MTEVQENSAQIFNNNIKNVRGSLEVGGISFALEWIFFISPLKISQNFYDTLETRDSIQERFLDELLLL